MNGDVHLVLKEDITWDDMMGTQKNLTCFQHVTIFLSIASFFLERFYKTWEAIKANFKVGNNERAARLQYLKKKPVTHRACSNHAICKADFGRSRSVCRVSCRNSANSCLSWNLRLLGGKNHRWDLFKIFHRVVLAIEIFEDCLTRCFHTDLGRN